MSLSQSTGNSSRGKRETEGFGSPVSVDPHHFVVSIPRGRNDPVSITEHYGVRVGIDNDDEETVVRCIMERKVWSQISEPTKKNFNARLRDHGMKTSRWTVGENKVERLLGKELLVLAWSVEAAKAEDIPNAIQMWAGFRPEERWWLYHITAASMGTANDREKGWRKALRVAFTETPVSSDGLIKPAKKKTKRSKNYPQPTLFDAWEANEDASPFYPSK